MSANPGWYPDPGGAPGRFRYWDGVRWAEQTSGTPGSAAPIPTRTPPTPGRRGGQTPMIITAAGVGLVLIIVAVLVITNLSVAGIGPADRPASAAPSVDCPPADSGDPTAAPSIGADGRVRSGPLSYPAIRVPWSEPEQEDRVPYGHGLIGQFATAETNTRNGHLWASAVVVGQLSSGDGFLGPEQAALLMAECITGTLYGDNRIDTSIKISRATTVDGHPGWLLEARLAYDVAGVKTKGETMIIVIVDAGVSTGLFYAGLPDTVPQHLESAREALAGLRVES